jgi:potassium intermediate/small conductance calcium-activated channel subfamily N protein 2
MIVLVFVFGYAIRICESPLNRNDIASNYFISYPNSFWNIIVTMTTLGYGDLYARTYLGRTLILVICIFGIFVVSMMVVTIINSLETSPLESKAVIVLQRVVLRK